MLVLWLGVQVLKSELTGLGLVHTHEGGWLARPRSCGSTDMVHSSSNKVMQNVRSSPAQRTFSRPQGLPGNSGKGIMALLLRMRKILFHENFPTHGVHSYSHARRLIEESVRPPSVV